MPPRATPAADRGAGERYPVQANREFAASGAPYDRWFKDRLRDLFPPFIDFDQPVPANETVWDWTRG